MKKGSPEEGVVYHAGFPNAAEDQQAGGMSLDSLVVQHRASTYFWRLEEDIPEMHWSAGTIVVVDRALAPHHQDKVVAVVDNNFVIREYRLRGASPLLLLPNGEIEQGADIAFWGVITYVVQGMR